MRTFQLGPRCSMNDGAYSFAHTRVWIPCTKLTVLSALLSAMKGETTYFWSSKPNLAINSSPSSGVR